MFRKATGNSNVCRHQIISNKDVSFFVQKNLTTDHSILQTKLANPALDKISMGFCFKEGVPDGSS